MEGENEPPDREQFLKKTTRIRKTKVQVQLEKLKQKNVKLNKTITTLKRKSESVSKTEKILQKNTFHVLQDQITIMDIEADNEKDNTWTKILTKNRKLSKQHAETYNMHTTTAVATENKDNGHSNETTTTTKNNNNAIEKTMNININIPSTSKHSTTIQPTSYTNENNTIKEATPISQHYTPVVGIDSSNKETKMPPINIYNQNVKDIIKVITKNLKIIKFTIKKINNTKHAINTTTIKEYTTIRDALVELDVPFFTYTPKQLKHRTFLLKGLNGNDTEEEVLVELKKEGSTTLNILKVKKFSTKKSTQQNKILPFFLVTISNTSSPRELMSIKRVNYQVVYWENLQKSDITQCFRCQRYGHTSANCRLNFRCVKCGQGHEPGNCTLLPQNNERDKLFCVQCQTFGHPASYKGCPKHIELLSKLKQKQLNKQYVDNEKKAMYNNFVQNKTSFASMFGSSTTTPQATHTTPTQPQKTINAQNPQIQQYADTMQNSISVMLAEFQRSMLGILQTSLGDLRNMIESQQRQIDIIYETCAIDSNVLP